MTKQELEVDDNSNKYAQWIKSKWRPLMAWQYLLVCLFDFLVAPIVTMIFSSYDPDVTYVQWVPLTIQHGGLYHMSMMAILGVYAWSRGQEKMLSMKISGRYGESKGNDYGYGSYSGYNTPYYGDNEPIIGREQ